MFFLFFSKRKTEKQAQNKNKNKNPLCVAFVCFV